MLVLASKKVSLKNQIFSRLSLTENSAIIMKKDFRSKLSIFSTPIFDDLDVRPTLVVKMSIIALTLLLKLIKASIN